MTAHSPDEKQPRRRYRVAPGPDLDLATQDIRDRSGRRITQSYVDAAVDDVHAAAPARGRPSLSSPGTRSPQITFRLPEDLREQAEEQARREGAKISDLARKALQEYLTRQRHAS